jgi:hypothetical protein
MSMPPTEKKHLVQMLRKQVELNHNLKILAQKVYDLSFGSHAK